ncbi:MAG: hypothetical protein AABX66_02870 [Nanoarchaeota archaeon]
MDQERDIYSVRKPEIDMDRLFGSMRQPLAYSADLRLVAYSHNQPSRGATTHHDPLRGILDDGDFGE